MRRLLYIARALWTLPKPQPAVDWTKEDTVELQRFLDKTSTGAKLKATLLNAVLRENASAVIYTPHLTYKCGRANGFREAVVLIQSMAMLPPTETSEPDSSDNLDHLSP
jgi:hypothetical protein